MEKILRVIYFLQKDIAAALPFLLLAWMLILIGEYINYLFFSEISVKV